MRIKLWFKLKFVLISKNLQGKTEKGFQSDKKLKVELPLFPKEECKSYFSKHYVLIGDEQVSEQLRVSC